MPDEEPFEVQIQNVIPLVADSLRTIQQSGIQNVATIKNDLGTLTAEVVKLATAVTDLSNRKLNVTIGYDEQRQTDSPFTSLDRRVAAATYQSSELANSSVTTSLSNESPTEN